MLAAPFTVLRGPHYFSSSIYAGFITWTLFCSNPLMLALAYAFDVTPTLEWQTAATTLGVTTVLSVIGAACTLASTKEQFRSTFYKHYTLARYVRDYVWHEQTTLSVDGELVVCDREFVQAYDVIGDTALVYWPMDLVEPFVHANWCVFAACTN